MAFRMLHQCIAGCGSGPCGEAGAAPEAEAEDALVMATLILEPLETRNRQQGCQQRQNDSSQQRLRNVEHICHCLFSPTIAACQSERQGVVVGMGTGVGVPEPLESWPISYLLHVVAACCRGVLWCVVVCCGNLEGLEGIWGLEAK